MSRRLQFSLRTLFVGLVLTCLGLGLWHRYVWMPHVELRPGAFPQRFRLQGRFLQFSGSDSLQYEFEIVKLGGEVPVIYKQGAGATWRRGWWTHGFEQEFSLAAEPGSYEIWLKPRDLPEIRSPVQIR